MARTSYSQYLAETDPPATEPETRSATSYSQHLADGAPSAAQVAAPSRTSYSQHLTGSDSTPGDAEKPGLIRRAIDWLKSPSVPKEPEIRQMGVGSSLFGQEPPSSANPTPPKILPDSMTAEAEKRIAKAGEETEKESRWTKIAGSGAARARQAFEEGQPIRAAMEMATMPGRAMLDIVSVPNTALASAVSGGTRALGGETRTSKAFPKPDTLVVPANELMDMAGVDPKSPWRTVAFVGGLAGDFFLNPANAWRITKMNPTRFNQAIIAAEGAAAKSGAKVIHDIKQVQQVGEAIPDAKAIEKQLAQYGTAFLDKGSNVVSPVKILEDSRKARLGPGGDFYMPADGESVKDFWRNRTKLNSAVDDYKKAIEKTEGQIRPKHWSNEPPKSALDAVAKGQVASEVPVLGMIPGVNDLSMRGMSKMADTLVNLDKLAEKGRFAGNPMARSVIERAAALFSPQSGAQYDFVSGAVRASKGPATVFMLENKRGLDEAGEKIRQMGMEDFLKDMPAERRQDIMAKVVVRGEDLATRAARQSARPLGPEEFREVEKEFMRDRPVSKIEEWMVRKEAEDLAEWEKKVLEPWLTKNAGKRNPGQQPQYKPGKLPRFDKAEEQFTDDDIADYLGDVYQRRQKSMDELIDRTPGLEEHAKLWPELEKGAEARLMKWAEKEVAKEGSPYAKRAGESAAEAVKRAANSFFGMMMDYRRPGDSTAEAMERFVAAKGWKRHPAFEDVVEAPRIKPAKIDDYDESMEAAGWTKAPTSDAARVEGLATGKVPEVPKAADAEEALRDWTQPGADDIVSPFDRTVARNYFSRGIPVNVKEYFKKFTGKLGDGPEYVPMRTLLNYFTDNALAKADKPAQGAKGSTDAIQAVRGDLGSKLGTVEMDEHFMGEFSRLGKKLLEFSERKHNPAMTKRLEKELGNLDEFLKREGLFEKNYPGAITRHASQLSQEAERNLFVKELGKSRRYMLDDEAYNRAAKAEVNTERLYALGRKPDPEHPNVTAESGKNLNKWWQISPDPKKGNRFYDVNGKEMDFDVEDKEFMELFRRKYSGKWFDPQMLKEVKAVKQMTSPDKVAALAAYNHWYAGWILGAPDARVRDIADTNFKNYLYFGTDYLKNNIEALKAREALKRGEDYFFLTDDLEKISYRQMLQEMYERDLLSGGAVGRQTGTQRGLETNMEVVGERMTRGRLEEGARRLTGNRAPDAAYRMLSTNPERNPLPKNMLDFGAEADNLARQASYITARKRLRNADDAVIEALIPNFDYHSTSPWLRKMEDALNIKEGYLHKASKDWMLFTNFARKNTPYWFQQLLKDPGRAVRTPQAIRAYNASNDGSVDPALLPGWVNPDAVAVESIGQSDEGETTARFADLSGMSSMLAAINFDTVEDPGSMLSPLISGAYALVSGKNPRTKEENRGRVAFGRWFDKDSERLLNAGMKVIPFANDVEKAATAAGWASSGVRPPEGTGLAAMSEELAKSLLLPAQFREQNLGKALNRNAIETGEQIAHLKRQLKTANLSPEAAEKILRGMGLATGEYERLVEEFYRIAERRGGQ